MKAVTYQGIKGVEVKEVPDAKIEKTDDIVVRITTTAICSKALITEVQHTSIYVVLSY